MKTWVKTCASAIATVFLCAGCGKSTPVATSPTAEKTAAERKELEAFSHPNGKPYKKPRAFLPGPTLAGKTSRDQEYSLAWHQFNSVEEYKRIGRKNSAWDADALAALDAYASVIASPVDLQDATMP
jgi:hypothetical protein